MTRAIAIIPARGGSKRVPGKNVRPFMGQPLITFSIRAAHHCPLIKRTIVSTDDSHLAQIAEGVGAEVRMRPAKLSTDVASTFSVLEHLRKELLTEGENPDLIALLQPTSPLRQQSLLTSGIELIDRTPQASSLVSVYEERLFTGSLKNSFWVPDFPEDTRSQDIPPKYIPTGSLYIYRCQATIDKGSALGSHTLPLIEEKSRVVNIDHEHDFERLEEVFKKLSDDYSYLLEP